MQVKIWHCENTRDSFFYRADGKIFNQYHALQQFLDGDTYKEVATLEIEGETVGRILDRAYCSTQNIDAAWRPENPTRSTSVGDILECNGTIYIVASIGFDVLSIERHMNEMKRRYEEMKKKRKQK